MKRRAKPLQMKKPVSNQRQHIDVNPDSMARIMRALGAMAQHGNPLAVWMHQNLTGQPFDVQHRMLGEMYFWLEQAWVMLPIAASGPVGLGRVIVSLGPAPAQPVAIEREGEPPQQAELKTCVDCRWCASRAASQGAACYSICLLASRANPDRGRFQTLATAFAEGALADLAVWPGYGCSQWEPHAKGCQPSAGGCVCLPEEFKTEAGAQPCE